MKNFEYYNPVRVVFGEGTAAQVGGYAAEYAKRALIITYEDISFYGQLFQDVHDSLTAAGVEFSDLLLVTANPTLTHVKRGIARAKEFGAELLIGIGGGSVLDCTKAVAAGVLYPYDEVRRMIRYEMEDTDVVPPREALPTIMIPTLPATGSEMNSIAVITDDVRHKKAGLFSPCIYPKVAIMDPSLSATLPKYQTACGGIDIISHVVESYFNGSDAYDLVLQDNLQEGVVRTVLEELRKVLDDPSDVQARGVLQWSAAIAQNGWVNSGTFVGGPMHEMAHVISARYNATHGAAISVIMIAWLKFFANRPDNGRFAQFTERIYGKSLAETAVLFENMAREMGVQTHLSEFGAKESDIPELMADVISVGFDETDRLPGGVPLTREEVERIYRIAY